jgi:nitroreductase
MLLAVRALGLGATLTTPYLQFEKEVEAALGLPPNVHSYALLPIGYPMGRFGPVRRVPLSESSSEIIRASLSGICRRDMPWSHIAAARAVQNFN